MGCMQRNKIKRSILTEGMWERRMGNQRRMEMEESSGL